MAFTLCISGAAIAKAGADADTTVTLSGGLMDKWSDEVEGRICMETRYDWITNYADVKSSFQGALSDVASSLIANKIIGYEMNGWASVAKAQTLIDLNHTTATNIISDLAKKEVQEVMF